MKLQTDSLTYAINYIKIYMTDYVAGNELNADFYAYVYILIIRPSHQKTAILTASSIRFFDAKTKSRKISIKTFVSV